MSKAELQKNIWGEFFLNDQEIKVWQIGSAILWMKKVEKEFWIAVKHLDETKPIPKDAVDQIEELIWSRWQLPQQASAFHLIPSFPDRSVVVKPEHPFYIAQKAKAIIYIRVPLWIRVSANKDKTILITDVPTVVLSKTWFGDFIDGELCYWITSGAQQSFDLKLSKPFQAICEVNIHNDSSDILFVEKICLRVRNLTVFEKDQRYFSDQVSLTFKGMQTGSEIRMSGKAPSIAPDARKIGEPRVQPPQGFIARSFISILKELHDLGLKP